MNLEQKTHQLLDEFYQRRITKLNTLKLHQTLKKKNPYLFKAVGIEKASEVVESMLSAYMSSSDETIFGDAFFEPLARFAAAGEAAPSPGVDIVQQTETHYKAVAVKSGKNVFNAQSRRKQFDEFNSLRTRMRKLQKIFDPVVGYCYGKKQQRADSQLFRELAGQDFWAEITGQKDFYLKIVRLMKDVPSKHAAEYEKAWGKALNRFTRTFTEEFCNRDGAILWEKLVEFNSAS